MSIEKKLNKIIMDSFNLEMHEVNQASMGTISSWDSLSHIELILTLEEEFDLPKITPEEIILMVTVPKIKKIFIKKGLTL